MSAKDARRMDAFMQYGVVAGIQAMRDSGLQVTESNSERIGIMMGSGMGGLESIEADLRQVSGDPLAEKSVAVFHSRQHHQSGERTPVHRLQDHRPESRQLRRPARPRRMRIGMAMRLIQYGEADAMLAGGSEMATCVTGMSGFAQAKALSQRNDDPQAARAARGTRIATASSWATAPARMMLEEYEQAKARGAKIYAELVGFGMSGDAFHVTAPPENGEGARKAMSKALADAQARIPRAGAVRQCARHLDRAWAIAPKRTAIRRAFGTAADKLAVSSTKSMTGHLLGAAGVVEAIFSVIGAARSSGAADHQSPHAGRRLRS